LESSLRRAHFICDVQEIVGLRRNVKLGVRIRNEEPFDTVPVNARSECKQQGKTVKGFSWSLSNKPVTEVVRHMFKSGFELVTDLQLDAAKFNKTMITVWTQGHILDHSGYIKSFTEHTVTIDDFKYPRDNCIFKVR
jgi:hypothetical protein